MDDLTNRFAYHPPKTDAAAGLFGEVRQTLLETAQFVEGVTPLCREQALALTHLEEAMFWTNAAIARNQ